MLVCVFRGFCLGNSFLAAAENFFYHPIMPGASLPGSHHCSTPKSHPWRGRNRDLRPSFEVPFGAQRGPLSTARNSHYIISPLLTSSLRRSRTFSYVRRCSVLVVLYYYCRMLVESCRFRILAAHPCTFVYAALVCTCWCISSVNSWPPNHQNHHPGERPPQPGRRRRRRRRLLCRPSCATDQGGGGCSPRFARCVE